MKIIMTLMLVLTVILTACNYEAPTDVTKYDDYSEIKWSSKDLDEYPGLKEYLIYLPSQWCPQTDSIRPWITYCIDGVKYERTLIDYELQNPDKGYEDYYREIIWANRNKETIVYLKFGNYKDMDFYLTAKINPASAYAVNYDVTTDKKQQEIILAFRLYNGQVYPIDKNDIRPIRADIIVPNGVVLNQPNQFWLNNLEYTPSVGIASIVWLFPDGYTRYGWNVTHTLQARGPIKVTITDHLGKRLVIYRDV